MPNPSELERLGAEVAEAVRGERRRIADELQAAMDEAFDCGKFRSRRPVEVLSELVAKLRRGDDAGGAGVEAAGGEGGEAAAGR